MKKVEVNETETSETAASNWKDEAVCLPASFRDIVAAADEGKGFTTEDLGLLVKVLVQNNADGLTGMLRIVAITLLKEMRTMAAAHKRKREKNRERQRAHRMSRSVTSCHAQNREEKNREGETRKDINSNTDNNNNTKQKQTDDVDDDVNKAQKTSSSSSTVDVGCERWAA